MKSHDYNSLTMINGVGKVTQLTRSVFTQIYLQSDRVVGNGILFSDAVETYFSSNGWARV